MSLILKGSTSELILTTPGTLAMDNEGSATLTRGYACATSYETTADALLAIDSAPLDYPLPTGVSVLVCINSTKTRANGITSYSVTYVGVTNQVYRILYGTSILSYSKKVGAVQYTGTYTAPTCTTYSISDTGGTVPSIPASGYNISVLQSYVDGSPGSAPTLTSSWLLTSLRSTARGAYYIIEATGTRTVTG